MTDGFVVQGHISYWVLMKNQMRTQANESFSFTCIQCIIIFRSIFLSRDFFLHLMKRVNSFSSHKWFWQVNQSHFQYERNWVGKQHNDRMTERFFKESYEWTGHHNENDSLSPPTGGSRNPKQRVAERISELVQRIRVTEMNQTPQHYWALADRVVLDNPRTS